MFKIIFFLLFTGTLCANNLSISGVTLTDQNTTTKTIYIQFNVSWDNSFRDAINWDAAWIFFKVKGAPLWQHARLSPNVSDYTAPAGSAISPSPDSLGFFIYRSAISSGTNNFTGVKAKWYYGASGFTDNELVNINAFGIEMVNIPQSPYYLGDGSGIVGSNFCAGNNLIQPYQITSETFITLGGTVPANLGNSSDGNDIDDFDNSITQILPTEFPKGYKSFYCMKYEISQEQYKDFLNTLTRTQQVQRVQTNISGSGTVANRFVMSNTSLPSVRNSIKCIAAIPAAPEPLTFYCDLNDNDIYNEIDDGQTIACNFLSETDKLAYSDWASLRPITEMEYEKICRGNLSPVMNEFSWGAVNITPMTAVTNPGQPNESAVSGNANIGNVFSGPVRVGIFAATLTSRAQAGSSFYGVLNLTDNLNESFIHIGSQSGRLFTSLPGDGNLSSTGTANTPGWNYSAYIIRGGSFATTNFSEAALSKRIALLTNMTGRNNFTGARLCR